MMRLNPLVGWEDTSGRTSRDALEPHVPLVQKGAEGRYAEVYNTVNLPIAVVLRPPDWFNGAPFGTPPTTDKERREEAMDIAVADKLSAILLVILVGKRGSSPFYAQKKQARGQRRRETPFTPFTLLHRLADESQPSYVWTDEMADMSNGYQDARYETMGVSENLAILSRGVDTAAGRMGVLADVESDLFAKYLLTGRIAYSPTDPPSESGAERKYRALFAKALPPLFQAWERSLREKAPLVFYINN
jgi:hypothetical protein